MTTEIPSRIITLALGLKSGIDQGEYRDSMIHKFWKIFQSFFGINNHEEEETSGRWESGPFGSPFKFASFNEHQNKWI